MFPTTLSQHVAAEQAADLHRAAALPRVAPASRSIRPNHFMTSLAAPLTGWMVRRSNRGARI